MTKNILPTINLTIHLNRPPYQEYNTRLPHSAHQTILFKKDVKRVVEKKVSR